MISHQNDKTDLLLEIGVEEIPAIYAADLSTTLAQQAQTLLEKAKIQHEGIFNYTTPRRLALIISQLANRQPDRDELKTGPLIENLDPESLQVKGFAKSLKVTVDQLVKIDSPKGERYALHIMHRGKRTADILPELLTTLIVTLPIKRPMRWGNNKGSFIRPIRWIVAMHGSQVVPCSIFGIQASNITYGHALHRPKPITLQSPNTYLKTLKTQGKVLVDHRERQKKIESQLKKAKQKFEHNIVSSPALINEVTHLIEWPTVVYGEFSKKFLKLPKEVLITVLQKQQRFFPMIGQAGDLEPYFIGIANAPLDKVGRANVKDGYEKVVVPRLEDAAFFLERDQNAGIDSFVSEMDKVVFQKELGSLMDKARRMQYIMTTLAQEVGLETYHAKRSALLAKADLLSEMVGEFPELQGCMGGLYAMHNQEDKEIATAIAQHYLPTKETGIPSSKLGQLLALSDRIDTLVGFFLIGATSSSEGDPFGLRRAALSIIRILVEGEWMFSLKQLIAISTTAYQQQSITSRKPNITDELVAFIHTRMHHHYKKAASKTPANIDKDCFTAAAPYTPYLYDLYLRAKALQYFKQNTLFPELSSLFKRVQNILLKAQSTELDVEKIIFDDPAEKHLKQNIDKLQTKVNLNMERKAYQAILIGLTEIQEPVHYFFEKVMVMSPNKEEQNRRTALLQKLQTLICSVADVTQIRR